MSTTHTWTVRSNDGRTFVAKHFVMATGPLHVPQVPKLPGLEKFALQYIADHKK